MTEITNALFTWLLSSDYAQYAGLVVFVSYVLSHTVQYLPAKVTEKIPDLIMIALNVLAAKHGSVSASKTDLAGNPTDE